MVSGIMDLFRREPSPMSPASGNGESAAARRAAQTNRLLTVPEDEAGEAIRQRWNTYEKRQKNRMAELKVNLLRYLGYPWVQLHPIRPGDVWLPRQSATRKPPVENKTMRAIDRYVAQITADEPALEAFNSQGEDEDRDAAEAATVALMSEWLRMRLTAALDRLAQGFSVLRSAYIWFWWDPGKGGREPARKYVKDPETGESRMVYVGMDGQEVPSAEEAAVLPKGDLDCRVLLPHNVRWSEDAEYAHDASEVLIGLLLTLRELYERYPTTREIPLEKLAGETPSNAKDFMLDLTGEELEGEPLEIMDETTGKKTGDELAEGDVLLDKRVFYICYYRNPKPLYPDGMYAHVVGRTLIPDARGPLPWGIPPLAHFKCLESLADKLGRSVVDLVKDSQELISFVHTQILAYLQQLRPRTLLPIKSVINKADLANPNLAFIEYNPNAGEVKELQPPSFSDALVQWLMTYERAFDDQLGIHPTSRGVHEPGITSGEHAAQIKSGDETVLGLTRKQMVVGIEQMGRIILKAVQKEWTLERKVVVFGRDRDYVTKAFSGADFSRADDVRLVPGSLLMITPKQRLSFLQMLLQMGAISQFEMRRYAPMADTAGITLSQDAFYQRARRQNERFLGGPPDALVEAYDAYQAQAQQIEADAQMIAAGAQAEPLAAAMPQAGAAQADVEQRLMALTEEWQARLAAAGPVIEPWEQDPMIAAVAYEETVRMLATRKAEEKPGWWRAPWIEHAYTLGIMAQRIMPAPVAPEEQEQANPPTTEPPAQEGQPVEQAA